MAHKQVNRIGIYSGTFDPVHDGHIALAKQAAKACNLDKIYFLVEPRPRRKQGIKALEHRDEMVRLAIKDQPNLSSIMLGQARFTAKDTLPVLRARFKGAELVMLMGDDMLNHFADWPDVDYLIKDLQFAIALRSYTKEQVNDILRTIQTTRGLKIDYHLFDVGREEFSSTAIRAQIRRGQIPAGLHPDVLSYIADNQLYASSKLGS